MGLSLSPKAWEPGKFIVQVLICTWTITSFLSKSQLEDRGRLTFQLRQSGRESKLPSSIFFTIQALNCLDDAHPHRKGQSALLCLPIRMLGTSGSILTYTPRNVWLNICDSVSGHIKSTITGRSGGLEEIVVYTDIPGFTRNTFIRVNTAILSRNCE